MNASLLEIPFTIDVIDPIAAPDGSGAVWHRYVISQASVNTISGMRLGTRSDVGVELESMVQRLNERNGKQYAKRRS